MSKGFPYGLDAMAVRIALWAAIVILKAAGVLWRAAVALFRRLSAPVWARKKIVVWAAVILPATAAAVVAALAASWPGIVLYLELQAPHDVFGIKRLYPTEMSGQHWDSRSWLGRERTLSSVQADPYDPYLQARGISNTLVMRGDGTAESSGEVVRYYISDPEGRRLWKNFEFTMYSMRVAEDPSAPSYAGFAVQGRTGPGHTDDERTNSKGYPIQCDGSSYSAAIRYSGSADFKKEILWPNYTQDNPKTMLYPDGVPKNRWIGMKYIVYNVNGGQDVKMELWVDETGGREGGDWKKVMEYVDSGGWAILSEDDASTCGFSVDEKLLDGGPAIIVRNDGVVKQLYKNISIREIVAPPAANPA